MTNNQPQPQEVWINEKASEFANNAAVKNGYQNIGALRKGFIAGYKLAKSENDQLRAEQSTPQPQEGELKKIISDGLNKAYNIGLDILNNSPEKWTELENNMLDAITQLRAEDKGEITRLKGEIAERIKNYDFWTSEFIKDREKIKAQNEQLTKERDELRDQNMTLQGMAVSKLDDDVPTPDADIGGKVREAIKAIWAKLGSFFTDEGELGFNEYYKIKQEVIGSTTEQILSLISPELPANKITILKEEKVDIQPPFVEFTIPDADIEGKVSGILGEMYNETYSEAASWASGFGYPGPFDTDKYVKQILSLISPAKWATDSTPSPVTPKAPNVTQLRAEQSTPQPQEGEDVDKLINQLWNQSMLTDRIKANPGKFNLFYNGFMAARKYYDQLRAEDKATIEQLAKERDEWERSLVSLTPGGSEFAGDAKACVEYVKELQASQHKMICEQKKALKVTPTPDADIEGKVREVVGNLHYLAVVSSEITNDEEYFNTKKGDIDTAVKQILSLISPAKWATDSTPSPVTPKAPNV